MAPFNSHRNMSKISLALANILIPVAVLTFATGFFPYKAFMPGLAKYEHISHGAPPAGKFDKVIFMVVDALRSDFVYSHASGFKFTQSLIRSGEALPFTAHATSPTITMPRVKAITTGSIPSFLDVILNFAESDTTSTLAQQDTWLAQIKDKRRNGNGRLVMYGDDTWLKLFPNTFVRADGTSSFFVSDFTEVDNNVTRHVPHELRTDDWDAMIMHYLGLDHIGHKAGPSSPNMVPKQEEMDGIVQQIYAAMTTMDHLSSTLLVLCGDHGMNEGGNHGGSAPGETSPALVFISPKLKALSGGKRCPVEPRVDFEYYSLIEQSDIAPTLAALLGFPIPLNNLGVMIADFLPLWSKRGDQVNILVRNARQMLSIVKATFPDVSFDEHFHDEPSPDGIEDQPSGSDGAVLQRSWIEANRKLGRLPMVGSMESEAYGALDALYQFCTKAQDTMSSAASNYDVYRLNLGIALALAAVLITALAATDLALLTSDGAFLAAVTVLYGVMMFASSYVEEEQHFWYWITGGWIAYLSFVKSQDKQSKTNATPFLVLLLLHRVTLRWNQTGQKFAGAPDIVHDLLKARPMILWLLVALTYLSILYRVGNHMFQNLDSGAPLAAACSLALIVPAFLFKLGFTASDAPELLLWLGEDSVEFLKRIPLVGSARLIFLTLLSETIWACVTAAYSATPKMSKRKLSTTLLTLSTLFLITQSRTMNTPLFLLFTVQFSLLSYLRLSPAQITITGLLLGQTAFFALGNSNAISSIDLSNAYNGVNGYNVLAVGVLVFLSNWAGPVFWSIASIALLVQATAPAEESNKGKRDWVRVELDNLLPKKTVEAPTPPRSAFFAHATILTLFTSMSLVAVMVACTVLRTHLFIWTVFSPKYLFAMAWSLAFHVFITLGLGSAVWAFCTRR